MRPERKSMVVCRRAIEALVLATVSLTGLTVAGCDDVPLAALDIELVPNLNINSSEQILNNIDSIQLIVDSSDGLYGPEMEQTEGTSQVIDVDGDPEDLEFVGTIPDLDVELPLIRLERGGLPWSGLELTVVGWREDTDLASPVAVGGLGGVQFDDGIVSLQIPFNLRGDQLPPRVVEVQPSDGDGIPDCEIERIVLIFSREIQTDSLLAEHITLEPAGTITAVNFLNSPARTVQLDVEELADEDTTDGFLSYRLTLPLDIVDDEGHQLDQWPLEEGAQPYSVDFTHPCFSSSLVGNQCGSGLENPTICPGEAGRLHCVEGVCLPLSCEGSSCTPGLVCQPQTAMCEVDCRLYGDVEVCPEERPRCDEATGSCLE